MSTTAEQTIRRYLDEQQDDATVDHLRATLPVEGTDQPDRQGSDVVLQIACTLAAIAGIGLITGTMLALTIDTVHVTTAGTIAAISGGGMLAVVWVGLVANWYRKRTMPVTQEEASSSNGKPKPSSSKQKAAPSKR